MGGPTGFAARRPHASNLPSFELPSPPLVNFHPKFSNYSNLNSSQSGPTATTLTSVGNLLTPPSNSSVDGMSPSPPGFPTTSSLSTHGPVQSYTPGGMWPPSSGPGSTYGYSTGTTPPTYANGRGLFSPSLNSIVRGSHSATNTESLPHPPYEIPYSSSSMPMSAPGLSTGPTHQHMMGHAMMGGVQHTSPVNGQEAFPRPPHTPSYYGSQSSGTPQQHHYAYSAGPSPMLQSPMSANGPLAKLSPLHQGGQIPSIQQQQPQPHQYSHYRTYSYPLPGPVLSNVNNPNGQLALAGAGMPHGMMPAFNSGHAAQMHHLYGHQQTQQTLTDRPFRCDQCPQSFNRNHDLKRHKRIHLAVKPFPCGHCDKSFSRKDALKVSFFP